jgi:Mrp family chromosome partitioning ATPase
MEDETQLASARVSTLQRQVKALQDTIPDPAFQVTLPLLEKRITSTEQDLEALRERREDLEERGQTGTQEARIISAAWRPDYASSPSPILLLPPAFVVFGLIGSLVAVGSRHFDRKLRSERDLAEILDFPCVGTIPMLNEAGSSKHLSELIDKPNSLYAQSIRGAVGMSIGIRTSRSGRRVVLVTSDVRHEGQTSLTESYVACAAQLGRKVLLVSMNRTPKLVVVHANGKSSGNGAYPPVEQIGFNNVSWDVLPLANTDADLALLLAKDATQHGLKRLFDQYDCVVIDAPSALNSIETRLMAPLSDIALMTVYKAVTEVEQLKRAIEILKRADDLEGDRRLTLQAVLAEFRPQRKRWWRAFSSKAA